MNIKALLMRTGYPWAWVQGHHTRIIMNELGEYKTLRRENPDSISSSYTALRYYGIDEEQAVRHFIESEEN